MNDERIEPVIEHEYVVSLVNTTDEETGKPLLTARIRTTREFESFAYSIALDSRYVSSENRWNVDIGGLSLPSITRTTSGSAWSDVSIPMPFGCDLEIVLKKRGKNSSVQIALSQDGSITIVEVAGDGFARYEVAPS